MSVNFFCEGAGEVHVDTVVSDPSACASNTLPWGPIGFGEGDMEFAREMAASRGKLVASEPPVAQAVYVCGWCFKIVDRVDLRWEDEVSGLCVCKACADKEFSEESKD
jgi:hypothetical protein